MKVQAPEFSTLDQCAGYWLSRWTVPGAVVATWDDGQIESRAYGVSNLETGYPMTSDTILQIGSISKIFTTTLLMSFVDEGSIDLDEPVSSYLPEIQVSKDATQNDITIRQLLTHTSGVFGDHFDDFGWGDEALDRYVHSVATLRQVYKPGELWAYTNSGFNIAGKIIESISGKTFEQCMRERVFEPLCMERTFYFPWEVIAYRHAVGHTFVDPAGNEQQVARTWPIPRSSGPAGSISSNVADMLKFAAMHLNGGEYDGHRVLSVQAAEAMQAEQVQNAGLADAWGLGWMIDDYDGVRTVSHGGTTNGFTARLVLVPSRSFAIVVLTNSIRGSAAYSQIVNWVLKQKLGIQKPDPQPIDLSESVLLEYAGRYTQLLADIEIIRSNGHLDMIITERDALSESESGKVHPPVSMAPLGNDVFMVTTGRTTGEKVQFVRNDDNTIRFVRVHGRFADPV